MSIFDTRSLKRGLLTALAVMSLPAAAYAGHFYIVHPSLWIPSSESVLFCHQPALLNRVDAPESEDYLIDEACNQNPD